jgi:maltoporin
MGIRGLKIILATGGALLTAGALFAQNTIQSSVDSVKAQMSQMQRQYEQRIEAMESRMKALESNADQGSILNARVLTDADGKEIAGNAPAPMLDESFLKSLTRNFSFSVYLRSGVGINGNGGPQDFDFEIPDFGLGRYRLGNEFDTYMELNFKQAHLLGDSPDVMDVAMTFTPRFSYNNTKTTSDSQFAKGAVINLRQAFIEAKNFIKSAPEITIWAGQRFSDRHDVHLHDLFYDDYSGYGIGVDNIDLGFGKLLFSYLGGIRDDIASGNTITDPRRGGLYMHTLDLRIHDIDLAGGKLELVGDYQFLKGGSYKGDVDNDGDAAADVVKIGDTSGGRVGVIYSYPLSKTSFWQVAAFYGYGASELFGVDPNNGRGTFAGFNLNEALGRVNKDGTVSSSSLRRASQLRAIGQIIWNVTDNFAFSAEVHYRYDDQGAIQAQPVPVPAGVVSTAIETTGGANYVVGGGVRPVFWVTDWLAIQGQAGIDYVHNNRNGGTAFNPNGTVRNDSFGKSGALGVFTIAPTIKPKGGWFTRPEFRLFGTYAIWDKSLRGAIGGTPYQNDNQGWLFGTQAEWFF